MNLFSCIHFVCRLNWKRNPNPWLVIFVCFLSYYISFIFSEDRASFPPEISIFVTNTESISTYGNPSKGKVMDANLEEVNKNSKVWQHGKMTALDWLRIFRNLGNLTGVSDSMFHFVMVERGLQIYILSFKFKICPFHRDSKTM